MPHSLAGNFWYFGPCRAGFGRRSLVAIFQFPFRWGRDRFDCRQRPVHGAPLGGLVGADAAAINERTFVFRRMHQRGQRRWPSRMSSIHPRALTFVAKFIGATEAKKARAVPGCSGDRSRDDGKAGISHLAPDIALCNHTPTLCACSIQE
jgi:hypothetical protein